MTRADRDLALFHVLFGLGAVAGVLAPVGVLGWRILALVVLYNVALPLTVGRRHREVLALWAFLVPLSAFQVLPDAFLADVLGVLVFPDTGGPRLGPVPLALAGMWTIPLLLIVWTAGRITRRRVSGAWASAGLAAVAFGIAEATLWAIPIWEARGVAQIGRVAVYVVPAEALLGAATFLAFQRTREAGRVAKMGAAAMVAVLYLGALGTSFYLIERVFGGAGI
ncbi:MAG: hypothetical protein AAGI52_17375 [Bacteroidota bacterium]